MSLKRINLNFRKKEIHSTSPVLTKCTVHNRALKALRTMKHKVKLSTVLHASQQHESEQATPLTNHSIEIVLIPFCLSATSHSLFQLKHFDVDVRRKLWNIQKSPVDYNYMLAMLRGFTGWIVSDIFINSAHRFYF